MKRKVSKNSTYNITTRRQAKEYAGGEYIHEGQEWNDKLLDELLEAFLVREEPWLGTGNCLARTCGRTIGAIKAALWKLAANYERKAFERYTPRNRTRRDGQPFTLREKALLAIITGGEGRDTRKPYADHRLEIIFQRKASEVWDFLKDIAMKENQKRATLTRSPPSTASPTFFYLNWAHKALTSSLREVEKEYNDQSDPKHSGA